MARQAAINLEIVKKYVRPFYPTPVPITSVIRAFDERKLYCAFDVAERAPVTTFPGYRHTRLCISRVVDFQLRESALTGVYHTRLGNRTGGIISIMQFITQRGHILGPRVLKRNQKNNPWKIAFYSSTRGRLGEDIYISGNPGGAGDLRPSFGSSHCCLRVVVVTSIASASSSQCPSIDARHQLTLLLTRLPRVPPFKLF